MVVVIMGSLTFINHYQPPVIHTTSATSCRGCGYDMGNEFFFLEDEWKTAEWHSTAGNRWLRMADIRID